MCVENLNRRYRIRMISELKTRRFRIKENEEIGGLLKDIIP
jgi:hypothetical protein